MGYLSAQWRRFRKLLAIAREPGLRRGLLHGVAAAIEHDVLLGDLAPRCVIDVGANVGQFALLMRTRHPGAQLHLVEPLPEAVRRLALLFGHDDRTTIHAWAAAARNGEAEINLSRRSDNSSLLPITAAQVRFAPGTEAVGRIPVRLRRLDDALTSSDLPRPILMKLDVQGYELAALQGCERLLDAITWVCVEVSFKPLYAGQALGDEIVAFLCGQGFRLVGTGLPGCDEIGRPVQLDLLFARPSQDPR